MTRSENCPICKEEGIALVDPTEEVWQLRPDDYEEDAEVWLCTTCGWNEEATIEEALEEHMADLEWLIARVTEVTEGGETK